jgi:hypothetical protein
MRDPLQWSWHYSDGAQSMLQKGTATSFRSELLVQLSCGRLQSASRILVITLGLAVSIWLTFETFSLFKLSICRL